LQAVNGNDHDFNNYVGLIDKKKKKIMHRVLYSLRNMVWGCHIPGVPKALRGTNIPQEFGMGVTNSRGPDSLWYRPTARTLVTSNACGLKPKDGTDWATGVSWIPSVRLGSLQLQ